MNENFTAYGLLNHRHTPEIEQAIGAQVLFTPHLAPMTRGILATCYARPTGDGSPPTRCSSSSASAYADEPFVVVSDRSPATRATYGSNCAHLTARLRRADRVRIVRRRVDNLTKGAAGQAMQCANVSLGCPRRPACRWPAMP